MQHTGTQYKHTKCFLRHVMEKLYILLFKFASYLWKLPIPGVLRARIAIQGRLGVCPSGGSRMNQSCHVPQPTFPCWYMTYGSANGCIWLHDYLYGAKRTLEYHTAECVSQISTRPFVQCTLSIQFRAKSCIVILSGINLTDSCGHRESFLDTALSICLLPTCQEPNALLIDGYYTTYACFYIYENTHFWNLGLHIQFQADPITSGTLYLALIQKYYTMHFCWTSKVRVINSSALSISRDWELSA